MLARNLNRITTSVLKSCQQCPLFKLNSRNSTKHQQSQTGKLQLNCDKKSNWTRIASKPQRTFNFVSPQLQPNYNLHPKILPTLSTVQGKWQERRTTQADSDRKVTIRLRQEVKSDADSIFVDLSSLGVNGQQCHKL